MRNAALVESLAILHAGAVVIEKLAVLADVCLSELDSEREREREREREIRES